jgi:folate-dependent phosphoribosylglycinamide formyltransferase PurN
MPIVSGGGTTMEKILEAWASGRLEDLVPECCVATRSGLAAYERWCKFRPPERYFVIPRSERRNDVVFAEKLFALVTAFRIKVVGLHGCTVHIPDAVCTWFESLIRNQHPGATDPPRPGEEPRPDFGGDGMRGMVVHEATRLFMLQYAQRQDPFTEATVHVATPTYDRGPHVATVRMSLVGGDTAKTIQTRLLPMEHELNVRSYEMLLRGETGPAYRDEPLIRPHEYAAHARSVAEALATTAP